MSIAQEGRVACFVVEDTGPGIEGVDVANVFQPFVRVLGNQETAAASASPSSRGGDRDGRDRERTTRRDGQSGRRFVYRQAAV